MKTSHIMTCVAVTIMSAVSAPFGCASRTERARERALDSTLTLQQRLEAMPALIDATVEDMMAATAGQNSNRAADFGQFRTSVGQLEQSARFVGVKYQEALGDSNAFFNEWVRAGRVQELSASERLEIEQQMGSRLATRADAIGYFERARTSFFELSEAMRAVEANLAGDLSEQNVLAQNDLVQRAIVRANDTKNYIERLDEVLSSAVSMQ